MQITVQAKLLPTKEQRYLIDNTLNEYIKIINMTLSEYINKGRDLGYSSKNVKGALPSALKGQLVLDVRSIYRKYMKRISDTSKKSSDWQELTNLPVLKKPVAIWNNQNYTIKDDCITIPIWDGKCKRVAVRIALTEFQYNLLGNKLGTLRITQKSGKYMAQIAVSTEDTVLYSDVVMGIDLGLTVPAVAATDAGKVKFFGNGRMNKYFKRKFRTKRKVLSKAKKLEAVRKLGNKEQRWMKDQDHKISRSIVDFAVHHNVSVIRLEKLSSIRNTARTSRKNEKNLHIWSFFRLTQYIVYKAMLKGIKVEYVDPKHTSQKCPICGNLNKAQGRSYSCKCGYKGHRDIVGAMNIVSAPVIGGAT